MQDGFPGRVMPGPHGAAATFVPSPLSRGEYRKKLKQIRVK